MGTRTLFNSGGLVFVHDGTLFAAPFDLTGWRSPGAGSSDEGVASNSQTARRSSPPRPTARLCTCQDRTPGPGISLRWMDHAGKATALLQSAGNWINPRFSPDGERVAWKCATEPRIYLSTTVDATR